MLDGLLSVDFFKPAEMPVVIDYGCRLLVKDPHPFAENLFGVVRPLYQRLTIYIAHARDSWRVGVDVVDPLGDRTCATPVIRRNNSSYRTWMLTATSGYPAPAVG